MVEIYFCRHGQSVANAEGILAGHIDSPLNDIGRQQAREVAHLGKKAKLVFDHIYCSPLIRAKETAEIISEITGSPKPEVMNNLIERDFGILTGRGYSDIPKFATKLLESNKIGYFLEAKGAESFPDALKRAESVLAEVKSKHNSGKVLLATHGDLGVMLFAAFHNTPWKKALKDFHVGNSELVLLKEDARHKPHVFEIDQRGISEKL